jgi:hypothetical protein
VRLRLLFFECRHFSVLLWQTKQNPLAQSAQYDKNGEVPVVCNLLLQYRKNQRPINFSIADEN